MKNNSGKVLAVAIVVILGVAASAQQWLPQVRTETEKVAQTFAPQDQKMVAEANALMNLLKYEEAIKLLDSAIAVNPANLEAHRTRAEANYVLQNYEEAIPDLELVLRPDATRNPEVYLEQSLALATCCQKTKRYDRGIQALKDALRVGAAKKTEELQDVNHKLALLYLMKGDEGSAADWYDNAIESPPFKLPLYLEYAELLHKMKDYRTEFEVLFKAQQQAPSKSPELDAASVRLAKFLWNRGHKTVIASHQTSFDGYLDGAQCFLLTKEYGGAWEAGKKLIALNPERKEGYRIVADAYLCNREYKNAVTAFNKALEHDRNDVYLQDRLKEAQDHIPAPLPAQPK